MGRTRVIFIAIMVVGAGVYGFMRYGNNEYAEREVALDSKEAKSALAMFKQLANSTNFLAEFLSPDSNPIAQQSLLRCANQLSEAGELTVKKAEWSGEYFRVQISSSTKVDATAEHWFLLTANGKGILQLMGVQH
ncbi:MAG: hypothetical protein QF685_11690 [Verrucomicrobiota bacterium]|jgi:hypothetical protein|nr:hypothetical protein [Verrucomicrobiota bacterium]